ncbi:Transposase and inactivated derivatives [Suttonella ornithocola]|uniref:Transposase and inactivated derivatives n=1 Tax=Suttonella ornithocola TaxID=279832 RepID=A0A380MRW2_9GAMM|nr:Transposase and inactivated derivatives [Suttonella ornithocola]
MAYTIEIRQKAMAYWDKCKDIDQVIQAYGISCSALYSWKKLQRDTGELSAQSQGTKPRKIDREQLKTYVEQHNDAYLFEIAEHFACTPQGIFYALKSIGMTLKKRPRPIKNKTQSK